MTKSLIWRWIIILAVLGSWTYSIFPFKQRPFDQVFTQLAKNPDEQLASMLAEAQTRTSPLYEAAHELNLSLRTWFPVAGQAEASNVAVANELLKTTPALPDEAALAALKAKAQNPDDALNTYLAKVAELVGQPPLTPQRTLEAVAEERGVALRDYVSIYKRPKASNREVIELVHRRAQGKLRLGLDLRGGTEFHVAFDPDLVKDRPAEEVRDEIIEIIRNRVDSSGVFEPEIKPIGPATISIKVPSVDPRDVAKIRHLLNISAKLQFHLVHEDSQAFASGAKEVESGYERMVIKAAEEGEVDEVVFVRSRPERVSGRHISRAFPNMDQFGAYHISLQFDPEGAVYFGEMTSANIGKRMAIVLDGTCFSAPVIQAAITGGQAQITGSFTRDEARQLSVVLRSGNLPVNIKIAGEFSTNPTLGKETIRSSMIAGLAGMALVIIFMIAYYQQAGVVAVIALLANTILVLGTMPILDATITLPGIAGMILTIGMAVDANVLIFERMREEKAAGKGIGTIIANGYDRAFSTILDANLTTLFTAMALGIFGSGPIRGFAVTLSIGIIASMFTALFMTRAIFDTMLNLNWLPNLNMFSFKIRGNIRFLDAARLCGAISAALIVISLITFTVKGSKAFSVDFTGGTSVTYTYQKQVPADELAKALEAAGYAGATANYKFGAVDAAHLVEIILPSGVSGEIDPAAEIAGKLNSQFGADNFSAGTTNSIGGLVGDAFKSQAAWSVFWSFIAIIIYLSFRFEFAYALGAVAAVVHDAIIGAGLFLLMGDRQISLTVVAALLTLIGYSLNDTIVIFDRIRENLTLERGKRTLTEIINESISQTLSRTILTTLTVLFVVLTLFLFGGGGINDFALVLLLGLVVGSYSTIFIAAPVVILYQRWRGESALLPTAPVAKNTGSGPVAPSTNA